jgi:hypothetical protein
MSSPSKAVEDEVESFIKLMFPGFKHSEEVEMRLKLL